MKTTTNYALPYPESGDHTRTWEYWQGLAESVDTLLKSKFVERAPDGSINVATGGVNRPLPFATYANQVSIPFNNTVTAGLAVTLPAGRFTQAPVATASAYATGEYTASISATSATAVTVQLRHVGAVLWTGSWWCSFHAIQMLPGAGPGLLDAGDLAQRAATCHTDGCPNAEIPVMVDGDPATVTAVLCGVCNQPITDLVTP